MTRMAADAKDLLSASIRVIFSAFYILPSAFCIPLPREGERPRKPHRFQRPHSAFFILPSAFPRARPIPRNIFLILHSTFCLVPSPPPGRDGALRRPRAIARAPHPVKHLLHSTFCLLHSAVDGLPLRANALRDLACCWQPFSPLL